MACFLVPAAEAAIVTIVEKQAEHRAESGGEKNAVVSMPQKLRWLRNLLGGGSALLAFEHVWHGEVTPWFPFLTAMSNPADAAEMFHEMSTTGVCMAVLVTAVWGMLCVAADRIAAGPAGGRSAAL